MNERDGEEAALLRLLARQAFEAEKAAQTITDLRQQLTQVTAIAEQLFQGGSELYNVPLVTCDSQIRSRARENWSELHPVAFDILSARFKPDHPFVMLEEDDDDEAAMGLYRAERALIDAVGVWAGMKAGAAGEALAKVRDALTALDTIRSKLMRNASGKPPPSW